LDLPVEKKRVLSNQLTANGVTAQMKTKGRKLASQQTNLGPELRGHDKPNHWAKREPPENSALVSQGINECPGNEYINHKTKEKGAGL